MKMVGHQAVAEERERVACLGAGEIAKEHIPFAIGAEDIGSVVPAVDRVVNKVIACRSWKSSHESNLPTRCKGSNDELTPNCLQEWVDVCVVDHCCFTRGGAL